MYTACCVESDDDDDCKRLYEEHRPSVRSDGYTNSASVGTAIGDPHFTTFDFAKYTFCPIGDFLLLETTSRSSVVNVEAQIRTRLYSTSQATIGDATALKYYCTKPSMNRNGTPTFAAEEQLTIVIQNEMKYFHYFHYFHVFVNEKIISSGRQQSFQYFLKCINIENDGIDFHRIAIEISNFTVSIRSTFVSGLFRSWYTGSAMINHGFYVLPTFENATRGLLGNNNKLGYDDLLPNSPDAVPIPENSNASTIHHGFGMTWNVPKTRSLFMYKLDETYETVNNPNHGPPMDLADMMSAHDQAFLDQLQEICGPTTNYACWYDGLATSSLEIAAQTQESQNEIDEIHTAQNMTPTVPDIYNQTVPIVPRPDCSSNADDATCYEFIADAKDWEEARSDCHRRGARLTSVLSSEVQKSLNGNRIKSAF
jgi:hypothetical protein